MNRGPGTTRRLLRYWNSPNVLCITRNTSVCECEWDGWMGRRLHMMTSSNGNIFRVTGPLCGEFTGHRWIPLTKPVTRSFGVFFDLRLSKQSTRRWFETPSRSLWRHCNELIIILHTADPKPVAHCCRCGSVLPPYFFFPKYSNQAWGRNIGCPNK